MLRRPDHTLHNRWHNGQVVGALTETEIILNIFGFYRIIRTDLSMRSYQSRPGHYHLNENETLRWLKF